MSKFNQLTAEEQRIIEYKGTEMPFTGEYNDHYKSGTYICKRCNTPLYSSQSKFSSHCGWPSFDDEIAGRCGAKLMLMVAVWKFSVPIVADT